MRNSQKAKDQYELYRYCREEGGHERFLKEFEVAKRYYASRQWAEEDVNTRTTEGRLSFTINETFRTINAVRGELAQLSSDVRFDPTNGDPEIARVLNRLSEHIDRDNKIILHDDRVQLDGVMGGRGFWRIRIEFDENLQGYVKIVRQRPENTVLDVIHSPDPDTWDRVFTTEVVSSDELHRMFGKKFDKDMTGNPAASWLEHEDKTLAQSIGLVTARVGDDADRTNMKMHRLISHQFRDYKYKDCFVDKQTGDTSEIPENWVDEKVSEALTLFDLGVIRRKIKTIRWCVTCNDQVVHDEDSPYKFFDIVPYMPWFVDGVALSLFNVLKGPQDLLNYTVSEETLILAATAHAGWKLKQGSLKNMTARQLEQKGSRTGVVLELENVDDAERITPGQPATGFERFGDRARSWINDLGSVSPSMLGQQSEYANGKNISANLARAPVNLHAPLLMYQYSKQLLAERKLDLIQSYYTETRIMRIATSPYGDTEETVINQPTTAGSILHDVTVGKYSVRLLPVGSRMAADEFAFDELIKMRELGITVPNSLLVASSSLNAKSDVMEQLLQANGGEVSPEEERAKELELAAMELDVEDAQAGIEAKRAAAELARGRARRAEMDASFDPRTARAELDNARLTSEHDRAIAQLDHSERKSVRDAAIKMTSIAAQKEKAAKAAGKKPPKKQPR